MSTVDFPKQDEPVGGGKYRFDLLPNTKTCYRYLQVGLGVIFVVFVTGILVLLFPALGTPYQILVMPSLFIGLGFLLFGVGTHLHILHLNVIRMMEMEGDPHQ